MPNKFQSKSILVTLNNEALEKEHIDVLTFSEFEFKFEDDSDKYTLKSNRNTDESLSSKMMSSL